MSFHRNPVYSDAWVWMFRIGNYGLWVERHPHAGSRLDLGIVRGDRYTRLIHV